jgi:flavin reductase (DIM6/NTAB) family NADH-FMN oxidoreductase RutF
MTNADAPFDPRLLRDAFGCFATGVTVITSQSLSGERVGLTANSFTSLSLDPPLLLFCPANGASALPVLRESGRFAINILDLDGQAVADRFTKKGIDRFAEHDWQDWDGVPVLASATFSARMKRESSPPEAILISCAGLRSARISATVSDTPRQNTA